MGRHEPKRETDPTIYYRDADNQVRTLKVRNVGDRIVLLAAEEPGDLFLSISLRNYDRLRNQLILAQVEASYVASIE